MTRLYLALTPLSGSLAEPQRTILAALDGQDVGVNFPLVVANHCLQVFLGGLEGTSRNLVVDVVVGGVDELVVFAGVTLNHVIHCNLVDIEGLDA